MKFIIVVVVVSEVFIIPRPASILGIIALPAKPVLNPLVTLYLLSLDRHVSSRSKNKGMTTNNSKLFVESFPCQEIQSICITYILAKQECAAYWTSAISHTQLFLERLLVIFLANFSV